MFSTVPEWFWPTLFSAAALGVYDISKKHAVRDNSVMPVLFLSTVSGGAAYALGLAVFSDISRAVSLNSIQFILVALKSLLVSASWICVYYAMRELPISLASPIRASAPLWTFAGGLILFGETPTWTQGAAMLLIFGGYYCFSILGRMEGFSLKHKGIILISAGTLLGACSALYDKYLLNVMRIPREPLQFYFQADLILILGLAYAVRRLFFRDGRPFVWRWSVVFTGVLLTIADCLYFYAVSMPEIHISILSLVRRGSCVIAFAAGAYCFHDSNVRAKAAAMALILAGVALLALAG